MAWVWLRTVVHAPLACADALDGVLEVRSAYVNIDKGVFLLHARMEYPESPAIRDALRDGITVTFDLDARVERDRHFWFNAGVIDLTLRRELTYHAVSDRYVVRDIKSGDQSSFATLDDALDFLGKVDAWPIIVEPQLEQRQLHHQRARRRAPRQLALDHAALSCSGLTTGHASREWYTWSLPV